jgi:hypothetical protein
MSPSSASCPSTGGDCTRLPRANNESKREEGKVGLSRSSAGGSTHRTGRRLGRQVGSNPERRSSNTTCSHNTACSHRCRWRAHRDTGRRPTPRSASASRSRRSLLHRRRPRRPAHTPPRTSSLRPACTQRPRWARQVDRRPSRPARTRRRAPAEESEVPALRGVRRGQHGAARPSCAGRPRVAAVDRSHFVRVARSVPPGTCGPTDTPRSRPPLQSTRPIPFGSLDASFVDGTIVAQVPVRRLDLGIRAVGPAAPLPRPLPRRLPRPIPMPRLLPIPLPV